MLFFGRVTGEAKAAARGPAPAWLGRVGERAATPLILLLGWEALSRLGAIPVHTLAAPSAVLATFAKLLINGELPFHLLVSLRRVVLGLALSISLGCLLALWAGLTRLGEVVVDAPLQMLRTLPFLALVPLFILWRGIGEAPKIGLVALATLFPIYLTLYSGIRGVDPKLIEAARVFGLSGPSLIRHVILPGALPSALVGLRFALGISWLSLIAGEQINATSGIGYLVNDAREYLRTDIIVVCLIVYALIGLLADGLVRLLERRLLRWRPAFPQRGRP